jgi:pyridoxine/pyridoxamine 5'-phosphate oxidase
LDPASLWTGPQRLELITTDHHGVPGATVVELLRVSATGLDFLLDLRGEAGKHLDDHGVALIVGQVDAARVRVDGRVRPLGVSASDGLFAELSETRRSSWWGGVSGTIVQRVRPPWLVARRLVPHRWQWDQDGESSVWVPDRDGWMRDPLS